MITPRPPGVLPVDDEAVLVPVQQLDAVAALIAKHEDVPGEGIVVEVLPHLLGQAVEAAAEIDGLGAEPDADSRREAQHGGRPSSRSRRCRSVAASKPGATRSVGPPASTSSMAAGVAETSSATTRTGTKVGVWASRRSRTRRQA